VGIIYQIILLFSVELEGVVLDGVIVHQDADYVAKHGLCAELLAVAGCILLVAVGA